MYLKSPNPGKLLLNSHDLYARSAFAYERADATVRRNRARLTAIRASLQRQAQRLALRELHEMIRQKLAEDRLPQYSAPRIFGEPGVGGMCDACDKLLNPRQLVMWVPWPSKQTFAHLDADCFMAWRAMISSMAARRRTP